MRRGGGDPLPRCPSVLSSSTHLVKGNCFKNELHARGVTVRAGQYQRLLRRRQIRRCLSQGHTDTCGGCSDRGAGGVAAPVRAGAGASAGKNAPPSPLPSTRCPSPLVRAQGNPAARSSRQTRARSSLPAYVHGTRGSCQRAQSRGRSCAREDEVKNGANDAATHKDVCELNRPIVVVEKRAEPIVHPDPFCRFEG